jgi:hypothetical protein
VLRVGFVVFDVLEMETLYPQSRKGGAMACTSARVLIRSVETEDLLSGPFSSLIILFFPEYNIKKEIQSSDACEGLERLGLLGKAR